MREITVSEEYRVDSSGSSDGTQDKYQKDGVWYKIDRKGNEGCNENIVSGILACSNLPRNGYVSYEYVLINGNPGCMSKEFTKAGEEEITLYRLYANTEGGDIINRLSTMDYDDAIDYTVDFVQRNTGLDTGIAKDVLEYQLTSNGFDYIRKGK